LCSLKVVREKTLYFCHFSYLTDYIDSTGFIFEKSDNEPTQNCDDIYISYWHESNLIGQCKTQTSRIIVVIVFKRSDFKKSKGFLRVPILFNRIKLTVSNSEEKSLLLQNMTDKLQNHFSFLLFTRNDSCKNLVEHPISRFKMFTQYCVQQLFLKRII